MPANGPGLSWWGGQGYLEHDDFSSNRHPALSFCLSMISGQTLRVCPEGKPVPAFPDHALARLRLTHRDLGAFRQVHDRIEDHLIARLDAVVHFDFLAEITRDRNLLQMGGAVLDDRDMQAVLIEYNRVGRYDHRWCLARDIQLDSAIDAGTERAVRIGDVDLGQERPAAGL